jgi:hypothetical protein
MALRFIGEDRGVCWVFLEAITDVGDRVVVKVSHEAEKRYGLEAAREAAKGKFAYRQFESDGAILVLSIDCAGVGAIRNAAKTAEARV